MGRDGLAGVESVPDALELIVGAGVEDSHAGLRVAAAADGGLGGIPSLVHR